MPRGDGSEPSSSQRASHARTATTVVLAVAVCFVTVLIGSLRPALQATRVDPTVALRVE
ncbi:MAG: hypothetical protein ACRD2J_05755 [Thermoanaerobaculia bacterium]